MVKLKFDLVEEYKKFEMDIQLEIASYFQGLVFQKNAYLLREGNVCEGIYYIEKGCCRSFTCNESKEITTAFSIEHSIITSPQSYLLQQLLLLDILPSTVRKPHSLIPKEEYQMPY